MIHFSKTIVIKQLTYRKIITRNQPYLLTVGSYFSRLTQLFTARLIVLNVFINSTKNKQYSTEYRKNIMNLQYNVLKADANEDNVSIPGRKTRGHPDLNRGPLDLQSNALPLSYTSTFHRKLMSYL